MFEPILRINYSALLVLPCPSRLKNVRQRFGFAAGWMMERSSVLKPAFVRLLLTARGGWSVKASRLIGL